MSTIPMDAICKNCGKPFEDHAASGCQNVGFKHYCPNPKRGQWGERIWLNTEFKLKEDDDSEMRHKIVCKYFQHGAAPNERKEYAKVWYTVEMKARTYMEALEFLGNIANTCKGVMVETIITKIDKYIKL